MCACVPHLIDYNRPVQFDFRHVVIYTIFFLRFVDVFLISSACFTMVDDGS